jgi:nucleotide-binding universal stress UspA family protein
VEQHTIDLLVLGTHGLSPASRGVGSTAAGCIRKAHARVLLVEDAHATPFTAIVACVDFSETSRFALKQAVRVAMQDKARLLVLHVFDAPWHHLHYRSPSDESSPDFQKQFTDSLDQQLRMFCEPLADDMKGLAVSYHVIDHPHHGAAITKFTLENEVDLVVLGTRGRTNLRDLLIGSTAERVVRDTPCSILTVKPE